MKFNFINLGCFISIIIMLLLFKYFHIVAVLILIWYISNKLSEFFNREKPPKEFKSKTGTVYKQCEFCGTKSDRKSDKCPNCGKSFE